MVHLYNNKKDTKQTKIKNILKNMMKINNLKSKYYSLLSIQKIKTKSNNSIQQSHKLGINKLKQKLVQRSQLNLYQVVHHHIVDNNTSEVRFKASVIII